MTVMSGQWALILGSRLARECSIRLGIVRTSNWAAMAAQGLVGGVAVLAIAARVVIFVIELVLYSRSVISKAYTLTIGLRPVWAMLS